MINGVRHHAVMDRSARWDRVTSTPLVEHISDGSEVERLRAEIAELKRNRE